MISQRNWGNLSYINSKNKNENQRKSWSLIENLIIISGTFSYDCMILRHTEYISCSVARGLINQPPLNQLSSVRPTASEQNFIHVVFLVLEQPYLLYEGTEFCKRCKRISANSFQRLSASCALFCSGPWYTLIR